MNATELLVDFIEHETGFLFNDELKEKVSLLVKRRYNSSEFNSENLYFEYIKSFKGKKELEELISNITIGETYFFRNSAHWRAFRKKVIPAVIGTKKNLPDNVIRIWSAGCSTGEEAYTIAMILNEKYQYDNTVNFKITATDIDNKAISSAEKGKYTKNSFRGVDSYWIDKYFQKKGNSFQLDKAIMEMVTFKQLNFNSHEMTTPVFSNFDIIFCRNVLIYFKPDVQIKIINRLINSLNNYGFLFLGHSESTLGRNAGLKPVACNNTFVHQKATDKQNPEETVNIEKPLTKLKKIEIKKPNTHIPPVPVKHAIPDDKEIKTIPKNRYLESYNHFLNEDYFKAITVLKSSTIKMNYNELILCALVNINISRFDDAVFYNNQAAELSDVQPETYMIDALLHEVKHDYNMAIQANINAVFLDDNFFSPWFRLGHIFQSTGDTKKSVINYRGALKALNNDKKERINLFCGKVSMALLEDICNQGIRCQHTDISN